jgi:GNAT superfamily N-acetyltransferase
VRDPYKRRGLGSQLFEASLLWLKSEGVTYLELYHMINDERATAFWKKMGFMQIQLNCARRI